MLAVCGALVDAGTVTPGTTVTLAFLNLAGSVLEVAATVTARVAVSWTLGGV
jgi:predicted RNase H-like nuclease (RuvC/YqgF family)